MKLGLYGGGFKPFHAGHFAKLRLALEENNHVFLLFGITKQRYSTSKRNFGKPLKTTYRTFGSGPDAREYVQPMQELVFDIYERELEKAYDKLEVLNIMGSPILEINKTLDLYASNIANEGNVAVAILEVSRRQAARLPTLGASVSGSFTDTEKTDSTRTNISLRLSIPLIQGGMVRAQVKEAALNLEATRYNRESSRRQLRAETRAAFLAISSRLRRIGALAEAVRASGGALQAKEEGFAAGLNTNIEVLDAQRDLFRAQRDYLKERYDYVLELLQLEALIGDLNSDDVRLVNAWLE